MDTLFIRYMSRLQIHAKQCLKVARKMWIFLIAFVYSFIAHAQNQLNPSQFGSVGSPINGVYSLLGGSSIDMIGRYQWVGVDGAPRGYWLNGYIGLEKIAGAVGLDVKSHQMGVESSHEVTGYFAKGIRISESEYLGLSIGLGVSYLRGAYSTLDPTDIAFTEDVSGFRPAFSIGTAVYSVDRYFVGISIPRLILGESDRLSQYRQVTQDRVYSVYSVALFNLTQGFDMKPALLATYSPVTDLQLDVSSVFYAERQFGLGVGYRSPNFLTGHLELRAGSIQIGYAYQFGLGNKALKRSLNNSTHEVGVSYRFSGKKRLL